MKTIMIIVLLSAGILVADTLPDKVKLQNQNVVKMAAEGLSKELPKKVDAFTQLISIKAKEETLFYTFEINATQSDDMIIKKDKTRMQKAVTEGICHSSKRFLQSDISISYIYTSAKSKKKLFQFDVNKTVCDYPPEI
jgi:uncharacterized protein YktA (UPF0223 family)